MRLNEYISRNQVVSSVRYWANAAIENYMNVVKKGEYYRDLAVTFDAKCCVLLNLLYDNIVFENSNLIIPCYSLNENKIIARVGELAKIIKTMDEIKGEKYEY